MQKKWKHSLAGVALLLALGGLPASAAVINVSAGAVDNIENQNCSIIEAFRSANNDESIDACEQGSGPDIIVLPDNSTFTIDTPYVTDGENALPVITTEITIEGNGSTIERDLTGDDNFRIIEIDNPTINEELIVTINDTTITGGSFISGGNLFGAGIFNNDGTLFINDSFIINNIAGDNGGGIHSDHSEIGRLVISGSTISGNESGYAGGGIFIKSGSMTINNTTISGNTASNFGGGLYSEDSDSRIMGSTINNNRALDSSFGGGGIYNNAEEGDAIMSISNSTISNNSASYGGGISNFANSDLTATLILIYSTITGNTATENGGGILNRNFNEPESSAVFSLTTSIISGNSATTSNEISNTPDNQSINLSYGSNVLGHSGTSDANGFTNFTPEINDINATSDGTNTQLTNILDTTLSDNGGPTLTHNLVTGSPAVNNGENNVAVCPALDQRGLLRPFPAGAICDIGAVEFNAIAPPAEFGMCFMDELCGDGVDNNGNGFIDDEETCI